MRRAVRRPLRNVHDDDLIGPLPARSQPLDERRVFAHLGGAPDLHALAVRVVHQDEVHLRVLGEVAEREVLPVPAQIRERERGLVEHVQEAGRSAAVLHVGLPIAARRGEEGGAHRLDERRDVVRQQRLELRLHPRGPAHRRLQVVIHDAQYQHFTRR